MKIVTLSGGVGGAKLVEGFAQILPDHNLTAVVNTGDDFEYLGLYISPDLDTVCYTLAGLANPESGWGRKNDTFAALKNVQFLGGPGWFQLGDIDLATHLERSRRLRDGQRLSQITSDFCRSWGILQSVIPMSDDPVRTIIETDQGEQLPFQEYFVHRKCMPVVRNFQYFGSDIADAAPGVLQAIEESKAVVICPSNPWVSIDPILSVKAIKSALSTKRVLVVSPIVAGKAIKGPASKMYIELGIIPSAKAVAEHYTGLISGFIIDKADVKLAQEITIPTLITSSVMKDGNDRRRLAQDVLDFIDKL
jgi:LPPG:FO 2-phospho-L-lactate transferase